MDDIVIRAIAANDSEDLIALIDSVFKEYADQGVVIDLVGLDADLYVMAEKTAEENGEFWVAEQGDQIIGCIGYAPLGEDIFELKRLYLAAGTRGTGLGLKLLKLMEQAVTAQGAKEIIAWSDTRFTRAHRFYEREGYILDKTNTRHLGDPSNTVEYYLAKTL